MEHKLKRIAVFASGTGSNAQQLFRHFRNNSHAEVTLLLSNNSSAGVLMKAEAFGIHAHVFNRRALYESNDVLNYLEKEDIDFVVLAGFMWLMPQNIVERFPRRMLNLHPALLPKYGGKGMYGRHVHNAVIENKEKESGITVHYVSEAYDEGEVVYQAKMNLEEGETPESLEGKIRTMEHKYLPIVVEQCIQNLRS